MWLFDLFFLNSANLMSKYGYLEDFRESLGLRDNESRLYVDGESPILSANTQKLFKAYALNLQPLIFIH